MRICVAFYFYFRQKSVHRLIMVLHAQYSRFYSSQGLWSIYFCSCMIKTYGWTSDSQQIRLLTDIELLTVYLILPEMLCMHTFFVFIPDSDNSYNDF